MKILVCGGRSYGDRGFLNSFLDRMKPQITLLISGAQRKYDRSIRGYIGADYMAIEWAWSNEIPFVGVPAVWSQHGNSAGVIRNRLMLDLFRPDRVIAFPGNNGTRDMVGCAVAAGIPFEFAGW